MAHNLNFKEGKASFFTVLQKAWHGLGKVLDKCPTSEEAIKLAQLDYEVKLASIYAQLEILPSNLVHNVLEVIKSPSQEDPNVASYKRSKLVEGRFATYRDDTKDIFGVVGSRYEVIQNAHAFDFFDEIVGKGEAIYETAGALGKGETVFITAKLPSYIRVGKSDDIEKYLLLTTTHDGSGATIAMFTPTRVVCNNTLQAALGGSGHKVYIRHTKNAHDRLKEAHKALGIANSLSDELGEIFNIWAKKSINDDQLHEYVKMVFLNKEELQKLAIGVPHTEAVSTRKTNIINEVLEYAEIGVGQQTDTCKGTLFGAYNAITGYYQNIKKFKDDSEKMYSNILGANYAVGQKAFDLAYNFKS